MTYVRDFNPDKIYRRKNPSGWQYLRHLPSPLITSNQNLNGWNIFKNQFSTINFIDLSQTSFFKFSLTPYYSSSWDVTILLYESFKIPSGPKNDWMNWKRTLRSSKIDFHWNFQNDHFFRLRGAIFVRSFNPDKVYKPTSPSGWDIFQIELYPQMDSNRNLNAWT